MQIVSSLSPLALEHEGGTAVAMGYFDGIHIGHRAVIEGAVEWAKAHGAAPAVFTFKLPADSKMKGRRLLSTEDKHALIASLGVEYYLCPEFEEIRAMTPEQFVYGTTTTSTPSGAQSSFSSSGVPAALAPKVKFSPQNNALAWQSCTKIGRASCRERVC